MRKLFLLMFVFVVLLSAPMLASGEGMKSVTGSIQGYSCVSQNKVCPIGMEDAMVAVEDILVLLVDAQKTEYYVITNIDQRTLARHLNEQIKVVGYVDKKLNHIWAEEIYKGTKLVWSNKMQQDLQKEIKGTSPIKPDAPKNKK
jgi:hypothetical protein